MKKILVVNGPNMNLLGRREPDLYGKATYRDLCRAIRKKAKENGARVGFFQSNEEGKLITALQKADGKADGVILNPAGYTHTSVAIADTVAAISVPVAEVHMTDPDAREDFRKISFVRPHVKATFKGKGIGSYLEALDFLLKS